MVNQEARACKAWELLTRVARSKRFVTYQELAAALGTHHRADRFVLGLIQDYCLKEKLPPLTILVVNKHTGKPGSGFIGCSNESLDEGVNGVRGYDWSKAPNPFSYAADGTAAASLIKQLLKSPESSKDVYAKVKVRGQQQSMFRSVLMEAYEGRCAVTGLSFEQTLDACHIIPWSQCGPELRMNPLNGILMSCLLHRLFDLGHLRLDEDYRIYFKLKESELESPENRAFVKNYHGKRIRLPKSKSLWPRKDLIQKRNNAPSKSE
ncbi:MAG: HNH endonuclease [bacterium]|jgi:putative restriction endonuclease